MAHNNSSKGVLALVAVTDVTGVSGQIIPITSRGDLVFKVNAIGPGQDRGIGFIDSSELAPAPPNPDGSVHAEGAVLFVQFEDGSTWGDPRAAKEMIAVRSEKLAFLKHLVEIYDASGDAAFTSALNETKLGSPLYSVAGCLKSDAEYEKMPVIDLARKRLVAAQAWQASGIF